MLPTATITFADGDVETAVPDLVDGPDGQFFSIVAIRGNEIIEGTALRDIIRNCWTACAAAASR